MLLTLSLLLMGCGPATQDGPTDLSADLSSERGGVAGATDALTADLASAIDRIEALEASNAELRRYVESLAQLQETQSDALVGLRSTNGEFQEAFRSVNVRTSEITLRLGGVQTQVSSLTTFTGFDATDDFDTVPLDLRIDAIADDMDFLSDDIDFLTTKVTGLQAGFITVLDDMDQLSAQVESLGYVIANDDSDFLLDELGYLSARVEVVGGQQSGMQTSIEELQVGHIVLADDMDQLSAQVESLGYILADDDADLVTLGYLSSRVDDLDDQQTGLTEMVERIWDALFGQAEVDTRPPTEEESAEAAEAAEAAEYVPAERP